MATKTRKHIASDVIEMVDATEPDAQCVPNNFNGADWLIGDNRVRFTVDSETVCVYLLKPAGCAATIEVDANATLASEIAAAVILQLMAVGR